MVKVERRQPVAIRKKTDKIDIHLWIEEGHLAILDRLAREYKISRAAVIAELLEDYNRTHPTKEKTND
jgi:hypothetical protein